MSETKVYSLRKGRSPTRQPTTRRKLRPPTTLDDDPSMFDPVFVASYNDNPRHLYGLDQTEEDERICRHGSNDACTNQNTLKQAGSLIKEKLLSSYTAITSVAQIWKVVLIGVGVAIAVKGVDWYGEDRKALTDAVDHQLLFNQLKSELMLLLEAEREKTQEVIKANAAQNCSCEQDRKEISQLQKQVFTTVNVVATLNDKLNEMQKTIAHENLKAEEKTTQNNLCQGENCNQSTHNIFAVIQSSLEVYTADVLGIPDFAMESAGASIHSPHYSATCESGAPIIKVFGLPLWQDPRSPRTILSAENLPGSCWPMKGTQGYVVVKLAAVIKPTMVSLEHLDQRLDQYSNRMYRSAPKQFQIFAWLDQHGKKRKKLGDFMYLRTDSPLQSFKLQDQVEKVLYIELRVLSNYGNSECTCLYRFRVHGVSYEFDEEN